MWVSTGKAGTEKLRDDNRSCLVAYAGQRFQLFERLGYRAVVFLTEDLR